MGEWSFLSKLFEVLKDYTPMLGHFWLLLMLIFRISILGTVASDLFQDEQEEFACNTLQPGCKQVCYNLAFPISQYRFWVFHIVLIATPSLLFLMYHHHHKNKSDTSTSNQSSCIDYREVRKQRFYLVSVAFRLVAEIVFLVTQWLVYGFKVEDRFPCMQFPCPYTVDCFTSRPTEKTIFLCFYFVVGLVAAISSCAELFYSSLKWFCTSQEHEQDCDCQNRHNIKREGEEEKLQVNVQCASNVKLKGASLSSNTPRKINNPRQKHKPGRFVSTRALTV
ncbi:gap junction delta-3 protein-like [Periophthalmus magnuspinnatus]|uniref:Gap junction protein delta 3 n=1 Tax=Periophthalmus magnuspinnatus TaxID=409849 RepID=A0A3B3ZKW2_9GOBI|nr:gap junction delta-3 protein-like [Periophthalmus magnuspinnatus]